MKRTMRLGMIALSGAASISGCGSSDDSSFDDTGTGGQPPVPGVPPGSFPTGGAPSFPAGGSAGIEEPGTGGVAGTGGSPGAMDGGAGDGAADGAADARDDALADASADASAEGGAIDPFEECGIQPLALPVTNVAGTLFADVAADTTNASNRVPAAECRGETVGAAGDIVYAITTERPRDFALTLTGGHHGVLRMLRNPCDSASQLVVGDDEACAHGEGAPVDLTLTAVPAGTYYIVVDGAESTDRGSFTLGVEATCSGVSDLRLVELRIGTTSYVVLRNMGNCPAQLEGLTLAFQDSDSGGFPERTVQLPEHILSPGGQVRVQDASGPADPYAIDIGGTISFWGDRGGTALLCNGECTEGANVLDMVSFSAGMTPPDPPSPATFSSPLTGINLANQDDLSWVRIADTADPPSFTGADWCTGSPGAPGGIRMTEAFIGDPDYVVLTNETDCPVGLHGYRLTFVNDEVPDPEYTMVLPDRTLGARASVYVVEVALTGAGDIVVASQSSIRSKGGRAGTIALCSGSCSEARHVVDAIAFDGVGDGGTIPFPELASPVEFLPGGLDDLDEENQNSLSYVRQALGGNNPRFLAGDWGIAEPSRERPPGW